MRLWAPLMSGCFVALVCCGCSHSAPVHSSLEDPSGNVGMVVSNQSFAIDPVDINVDIDGVRVIQQDFTVGDQHNWNFFTFRLTPGTHRIVVTSRKGEASLDRTFEVGHEQLQAGLSFFYYPPSHDSPTPRNFYFFITNKPVQLQ